MLKRLIQRRRRNQVASFYNLRTLTACHHHIVVQQHLGQHVGALFAGPATVTPILCQKLLKTRRLRQGREEALFAAPLTGAFRTLGRHYYNATWANWGVALKPTYVAARLAW
jgi:hypothetical protein